MKLRTIESIQPELFNTTEYFNLIQPTVKLYRGNPNFTRKYSQKTTVIRVPVHLKTQIIEYAQKLDRGEVDQPSLVESVEQSSFKISYSSIAEMDPKDIKCDPVRFQYKLVCNAKTGSTGSLAGSKVWNEDLAGLIYVWLDPNDSNTYVINGHNRLDLAIRLNVEKVLVKYITAETSKTARLKGALLNIGDDKGTALDAAKVFRDSGLDINFLKNQGISLKKKIAEQGYNIAKLSGYLFEKALIGDLDPKTASAIGQLDSEQLQTDLYNLIKKDKRTLTESVLSELVEIVEGSQSQECDLFGLMGDFQESNAIERSELISYIKANLSSQVKLFGLVSKAKNKQTLEKGNNRIDQSESSQIAEESKRILDVFDTLKSQSGWLCDYLNTQATKLKTTTNPNDLKEGTLNYIFAKLSGDNWLDLVC